MEKIRIQAHGLRPGDIVGSGEKVLKVEAGISTPTGKIEIVLLKGDRYRRAVWNRHTFINTQRG